MMMQDPDRLFRRYQKTRDPERIAEVFDLVAPRLVRLAIHLVGGADEAEDLVQETFLAAIERADDFEAARELVPWLSGILANRARYARRRAARDPEPARMRERIERSPLEEAEGSEFSGALAKALDRLEEPYRGVLVLRLRHGLAPADIAHTLDESPGAVRVRIHRGMEKLRRLLPAGFASAAFLLVEPTRGLDAIRRVVVAKATAATVAGTTSLALGGILMTKQVVLAAVVVAAVAVVAALRPWPDGVEAEGEGVAPTPVAEALVPPEPTPAEVVATESTATPAARTELAATPLPDLVPMQGRVVDGLTELPIAGAMVELHAPTSHTVRAIKEEACEHLSQPNHGGFIFSPGGWPRFADESYEAQQAVAGRAPDDELVVYGRPATGSEALAITRTDADGEFQFAAPAAGGTLRCVHEDYAVREVAVANPEGGWEIPLYAPRRLKGRVVDRSGAPIEQRVALLLWNMAGSHTVSGEEDRREYPPSSSWAAETELDGTFDVSVPAAQVMVEVRTPGFLHRPFPYATGTNDTAVLYVQRVPSLHVTDAVTGEGLEHFAMIGREKSAGNVRWAGRFYARNGLYHLFREDGWLTELRRKPFDLTVWAAGYLPRTFAFTDLTSVERIDAVLERGTPPALEGTLLRAGEAAPDVLVQLQPFYPLSWRLNEQCTVDACRTREAGGFRLEAAEGRYVLRIEDDRRIHARIVVLPSAEVLVIDLARLAEIDVLVEDANGSPQHDHTVVLRDATGRSEWRFTDETGHVVFPHLPPGEFQVRVPRAATKHSFGNAIAHDVELADGAHETVRIEVRVVGEARRPRVVTDPPVDVGAWRARAGDGDYEWLSLLPDGTIPVDLQGLNWGTFEIESDAGRRWQVDVPLDAEDGHEIRIALDGPRYEGVLLDLATDRPMSGVRLVAFGGRDRPRPSAVTDDEGRFVLHGVNEFPHRFSFNDDLGRPVWDNSYGELYGVGFQAAEPPGDPTVLTIRIPRLRNGAFRGLGVKRMAGRVLRADGAEPLTSWRVCFFCDVPSPQGTLELWTRASITTTDGEGGYAIELPDVPRYRAMIYEPGNTKAVLKETWDGLPGAEETRDFVVE